MKKRVLVLALASLGYVQTAQASPEDIFGYGARTGAMGTTGVAYAESYEAAWANPALASGVRAKRLTLGYLGGVMRLTATGEGLPGRISTEPVKGAIIGAELPIPFGGVLKDRVGVVLGFYEPSDVVVRGRVLYPEKTQFPILDNRAQSVTIRAGLGADIGHGLRLGVGFAALAEITGIVVAATDATGRVGTRVEDQLVATYAPTLGVTYDLPLKTEDIWRLGLVYRGKLDARFSVVIDGSKLSSLQIPLLNIAGLAQYDPAQAALEVARIGKDDTLAAQVVYKRWSAYPGILEPTVVCTDGGPGNCGLTPPKIDWHDTFAVHVGGEHRIEATKQLVLRLRAGAGYETSPLPSDLPTSQAYSLTAKGSADVPTRYFDADRIMLTAGMGVSFGPLDLDLMGQLHVLLSRTISSGDLSRGDATGTMALFGLTAGVKF